MRTESLSFSEDDVPIRKFGTLGRQAPRPDAKRDNRIVAVQVGHKSDRRHEYSGCKTAAASDLLLGT
jgi:hypothetical protein